MIIPELLAHWTNSELQLHDKGIRKAIKEGHIKGTFDDKQIQPATLDVKVGKTFVYDTNTYTKNIIELNALVGKEGMKAYLDYVEHENFGRAHAKVYEGNIDQPIILPPKSFSEIYIDVTSIDKKIFNNSVDLRSSRGRLQLQPRQQSLGEDSQGLFIPLLNNNPNPITLYGGDRFAQLFFHPYDSKKSSGDVVTNPEEVHELKKQIFATPPKQYGPYLLLEAGKEAYRFKEHIGMIDTRKKRPKEELYDTISVKKRTRFERDDAVIIPLEPEMNLPANIGLQILHHIPYVQESNHLQPNPRYINMNHSICAAGWADPNYQGKVTTHPLFSHPTAIKEGDYIAIARLFRYHTPVSRGYGSKSLGSHYQGSSGTVSQD